MSSAFAAAVILQMFVEGIRFVQPIHTQFVSYERTAFADKMCGAVETLLQGRQETHFLIVLLSGPGGIDTTVTIPEDRQDESGTNNAKHTAVIVDSTEAPANEE